MRLGLFHATVTQSVGHVRKYKRDSFFVRYWKIHHISMWKVVRLTDHTLFIGRVLYIPYRTHIWAQFAYPLTTEWHRLHIHSLLNRSHGFWFSHPRILFWAEINDTEHDTLLLGNVVAHCTVLVCVLNNVQSRVLVLLYTVQLRFLLLLYTVQSRVLFLLNTVQSRLLMFLYTV